MNELIQRFAEIQQISYEEAEQQIGAESKEEIIKNIENFIAKNIQEKNLHLNRKQRRVLAKKNKNKKDEQATVNTIADTTTKLNYIDLIQKLRILNEKKEIEENEAIEDGNVSI